MRTQRYKGHCSQNHTVRATLTEEQSKTTLVRCETCAAYILPIWDEIVDPTARYRQPEGNYSICGKPIRPHCDLCTLQYGHSGVCFHGERVFSDAVIRDILDPTLPPNTIKYTTPTGTYIMGVDMGFDNWPEASNSYNVQPQANVTMQDLVDVMKKLKGIK